MHHSHLFIFSPEFPLHAWGGDFNKLMSTILLFLNPGSDPACMMGLKMHGVRAR